MIILTGASGFIGRRLAARLIEQYPATDLRFLVGPGDHDLFYRQGVEQLRSFGIKPLPCDLLTGRGLEDLPHPDTVFHLAANTHTWEGDHSCNDVGTRNLLQALSPLGPRAHFIFTSTTAVMDAREGLDQPMRAEPHVSHRPLSLYGLTKWRAEQHLMAEAAKQGFRLSIVRLCTVYGDQPRPNTFFEVLGREVARQSVLARLNWPALTSFVHVDDVVTCLLRLAANPPEPGQARVHLWAAESRMLAEVSRLVHRAAGLPYRELRLPPAAWRVLRNVQCLCRWGAGRLPASLYNALWRFNAVVNPVFNCDTTEMATCFPDLRPRQIAEWLNGLGSAQPEDPRPASGGAPEQWPTDAVSWGTNTTPTLDRASAHPLPVRTSRPLREALSAPEPSV